MTTPELKAKLAERIPGQDLEIEHRGELWTTFDDENDNPIFLLPVNAIPMGFETWHVNGEIKEIPYYSDQDVIEFVGDEEIAS